MSDATGQGFAEIVCVVRPESAEDILSSGYLSANPDVQEAGLDARYHFINYGHKEGREQWINEEAVSEIRERKLAALAFRRGPSITPLPGLARNFLTPETIDQFQIPEHPPISAFPYGEHLVEEIRSNPDKLYLDVGAGLRRVYYGNVVNAEIYPNISTDVVCVGEDLPFADAQFDGVFAIAVLEHTMRPWEVAGEICRVLKPGGTVLIDFPFLQAVHGYPHHYFNATPRGNLSLFQDTCELKSLTVNSNQVPMYSLWWILSLWAGGLNDVDREEFRRLTIGEIVDTPLEAHLPEGYCANLTPEVQMIIPAGSTLVAIKK